MPLRLSVRACAPPIELWPGVCEEALPEKDREKFAAKKKALALYFSDVPVRTISQKTGIAYYELSRMAKKCLGLADDGQILGFRALIPYVHLRPYTRKADSKLKLSGAHGGCSGQLAATLAAFDEAEKQLVGYIRKDAKVTGIPEKKLRPKDLHRIFLNFLKDKGVKAPKWPFNTKFLGARSIQTFMADVLARNFSNSVVKREEKEARAHLSVGMAREPILRFDEPYDAVEIDAYRIENHTCVTFRTPEDTYAEILLDRLWLIAAVDRLSTAILAYRIVYRSEVTADDVAAVMRDAVTKRWEPQQLNFPGLKYPAEGGLPSGVIERAYGAVWSVTMLDGALAHLAEKIHDRARKTLGMVINWGPGGHFERRPNVERAFRQLGQDLYRRLPSTTGSHPHNGRADNAEQKAITYKIRASDIEQLTDVTIAQHNATPSEGLSFFSPLGFLRQFLDGVHPRCEPRRLHMTAHEAASKLVCREWRVIRGCLGEGRRPYVQVDRGHYTSPVLEDAGQLIGQKVLVEIDDDDFRQVRVFLENGAELGFLKAKGRWSQTKHSRRTRKAINSLMDQRILVISEFDDPVVVYLDYLSTPTTTSKSKLSTIPPSQATDATRVAQEAGMEPVIRPPLEVQTSPNTPSVSEVAARKPILRVVSDTPRKAKNRR